MAIKTFLKASAIFLLLFNGFGAVYGGCRLVSDPSGATLQLPLSYLEHSPFTNYLIPGIFLIVVNGAFSFVTLAALLFNNQVYPVLVMVQGGLLCSWIIIQMALLKMFYAPLHATFLVIGACLFGCGLYLRKSNK